MARLASLVQWIDLRGGIAHRSEARAAGFTDHDLRTSTAQARMRSVRRSWIVSTAAPPAGVRAVEAGGRLTCLSEAVRRGLWVADHDDLHVGMPRSSSTPLRDGIRYHWASGPVPIARWAWHDDPHNMLAHIATCVPRDQALLVWESALRTRLVSAEHLARITWPGPRAKELAEIAGVLSDSGLETLLVFRLRPFSLPIRQQVLVEGHQVDLLVGRRLIVQIDGFQHHSEARDRRRDIAHDARLVLRGYTVLRFDYAQVLFGWQEVERTILLAVAQGLHRGE
ncbi:endonuclease domain-containing protein [Microbacterium sp. HJ5]